MKKMVYAFMLIILILTFSACSEGIEDENLYESRISTQGEAGSLEDTQTLGHQILIEEILTPFSEERAWVTYRDVNNELMYGVINMDGVVVWSIMASEVGWDLSRYEPTAATEFQDGLSCLYATDGAFQTGDSEGRNEGMIIINKDGEIIFDSKTASDGTEYYYLGRGDGAFLVIQHTADF